MDLSPFANLSRDELVAKARSLGVERPELMTRVELADEIVRRSEPDPIEQKRARGWLGVARDLVASVVESGLNLPDAAAVIRGERGDLELKSPEPVATVTLAEIYAAQGHVDRALNMLDEVLGSEPEHEAARQLRERLVNERGIRLSPRATPRAAPLPDLPASLEIPDSISPIIFHRTLESVRPEPEPELESVRPEPEPELESVEPELESVEPEPELESVKPEPEPEPESVKPEPEPELSPTLIVLRSSADERFVCWELGVETPADLFVQVVCFAVANAGAGVERNELTISITERRGKAVLESAPKGALVRAALGFMDETGFSPLTIASEVDARASEVKVTYRPPGPRQDALTEQERALAREFVD